MNIFKHLFIIIVIISGTFACSDMPDDNNYGNMPQTALVIWTGDPASDGCGWIIRIGEHNYIPDSLPAQFQYDSAVVNIKFEIDTATIFCGFSPTEYQKIKIKEITRHSEFCAPLTYNCAPYKSFPNDQISILNAEIKNNCLQLRVQYSGGCKNHIFRLVYNVPKCGTPPQPPLSLNLQHDSNKDACEALITKNISFDLTSLRNPDSNSLYFTLIAPGYQKNLKYSY